MVRGLLQEHLDKRLRQGLEARREQLQNDVSQHKEEQRRQKYARRYQKVGSLNCLLLPDTTGGCARRQIPM